MYVIMILILRVAAICLDNYVVILSRFWDFLFLVIILNPSKGIWVYLPKW